MNNKMFKRADVLRSSFDVHICTCCHHDTCVDAQELRLKKMNHDVVESNHLYCDRPCFFWGGAKNMSVLHVTKQL
jgi:hypothetical protein